MENELINAIKTIKTFCESRKGRCRRCPLYVPAIGTVEKGCFFAVCDEPFPSYWLDPESEASGNETQSQSE